MGSSHTQGKVMDVHSLIHLQRRANRRLLAPDFILPEQSSFFSRSQPLFGEQRLLLAILEDAIYCFQTCLFATKPSKRRLFQEAEAWIYATHSEWIFSFENVCEILDLHAGCLRSGLSQWKAEQLQLQPESGQEHSYRVRG